MQKEIINKTRKVKCYLCNVKDKKCRSCKGAGIYKATNYFMIVDGYAYQMDTIK